MLGSCWTIRLSPHVNIGLTRREQLDRASPIVNVTWKIEFDLDRSLKLASLSHEKVFLSLASLPTRRSRSHLNRTRTLLSYQNKDLQPCLDKSSIKMKWTKSRFEKIKTKHYVWYVFNLLLVSRWAGSDIVTYTSWRSVDTRTHRTNGLASSDLDLQKIGHCRSNSLKLETLDCMNVKSLLNRTAVNSSD